MKILTPILIAILIVVCALIARSETNAFTDLQMDSSNAYHCILAKERWASEQYLISNWCE